MEHLYFNVIQTRDLDKFKDGKVYCGVQIYGAPGGDGAMAITGDDGKLYFAYASHINNASGLYIYRIVHDVREIAVLHAREGSKPE